MAPRTREEKEQFFADLERLDHLSDDQGDSEPTGKHHAATKTLPATDTTLLKKSTPTKPGSPTGEPPKKRKASSPIHQPRPPQPAQQTTEPPRPSTADAAIPLPKPVPPPALRRTQSERTAPAQKGKRGKKTEKVVPPEDRIFEGLSFFFIPNKDDHPVRRIRIGLAIAHGAVWARSWDEPVTHVIIDKDIHIERASRELQDKKLPDGIPVVKDEWLVECLKYKDLRDPKGTRFRVLGMSSPFEVQEQGKSVASSTPLRKTSRSRSRSRSPIEEVETHAQVASGILPGRREPHQQNEAKHQFRDALDVAIEEMQELRDIPASLLEEDESDTEGSTASFSSFDSKQEAPKPHSRTGFICMEKNDGSNDNPNARTIDILQRLANHYDKIGEQFRSRAFRLAGSALRKQPTLIQTREDALKIKGIGESIAGQIQEVMRNDGSRRLDSMEADPDGRLRCLFMGVYGAGKQEAQRWVVQGHRTLEDLQKRADLTPNQKVGVEHYDDFQQRIPRAEVEQHAAVVQKALRSVDKGLELIIGGSYRRGSLDSGDIDLLIMKKDAGKEHLHTLMTKSVIPLLTNQGFLKVALASNHSRNDGSRWHGASGLPGSSVWRRLDLLFVPWEERGAALIYFTGNDYFNRSIRYLAGKMQMRLNQHGLFKDVIRGPKRTRVTDGKLVEASSERKIFELLGVTYRPPEHRNC